MSFEPQPSSSRLSSITPSPPKLQPTEDHFSDEQLHKADQSVDNEAQASILPPPVKKTRRAPTTTTNSKAKKKLGTTILPVTRVTRAAKQDKDIKIVSKEAVFLISVATEFFVRKLTDSAFLNAKLDRRVFVKYNDVAKAVQHNDEYMWLEDVIPLSKPLLSVLNDPTIPSSSTALTNQIPELAPQPPSVATNVTVNANANAPSSLSPPNDTTVPHAPPEDTLEMEVDEDELAEEL
ncbi:hypothetical protein CROQUDRAFT_654536 [Cronartium quercuum f. sp. fusiforme G11]|uniref:Transcription factor CBF/NF-Y/archaeal histone domain-containing protein n=1 Tax=Cronartium quercuum f. sp. fusiforme G11 TaxID=708437 RepID=A0A9P6NNC5_9BASI|nr:hypothetical protein CROQUDRAFT_654536 [Cronartium quercuum f. sp. fusiforme G11]